MIVAPDGLTIVSPVSEPQLYIVKSTSSVDPAGRVILVDRDEKEPEDPPTDTDSPSRWPSLSSSGSTASQRLTAVVCTPICASFTVSASLSEG